jgi:tripartite-type tricarboxylate transporter receptor subunit TctC
MRLHIKRTGLLTLASGLIVILLFGGHALSQTPYYEGKTIKILRGGQPGGTGDMQARALIPYLKKYIPGNPTIVVENMPGAAGRKAANHIFLNTKPDGLTIGAVGAGLVVGPILGLAGTKYDLDKLIYLGSTERGDPYLFVTRKEAGWDSLEKLQAASGVRVGAQGIGHPIYVAGRIFSYLLGLKDPKFVVGYGGLELDIAFTKGEIDARANGVDTVLGRNHEMLEKGLLDVHATITIPRGKINPRFTNVRELGTFAKNDRERQLLELFRTFLYPRWPYILPPATPAEHVKTLRSAMARAFEDDGFKKEFKKVMANEPSPLTGEEVETVIRELPHDPETVGLYKKMADQGPLPPRS